MLGRASAPLPSRCVVSSPGCTWSDSSRRTLPWLRRAAMLQRRSWGSASSSARSALRTWRTGRPLTWCGCPRCFCRTRCWSVDCVERGRHCAPAGGSCSLRSVPREWSWMLLSCASPMSRMVATHSIQSRWPNYLQTPISPGHRFFRAQQGVSPS